jgi:hypothetical protein
MDLTVFLIANIELVGYLTWKKSCNYKTNAKDNISTNNDKLLEFKSSCLKENAQSCQNTMLQFDDNTFIGANGDFGIVKDLL